MKILFGYDASNAVKVVGLVIFFLVRPRIPEAILLPLYELNQVK